MTDSDIAHPKMTVVDERRIADSPEAAKLQKAISDAMQAYADFLDRAGLFDFEPMMSGIGPAPVLVASFDFESTTFTLEGGPVDLELNQGHGYRTADHING
jgi:hypothetical protein